MLENQSRIKLKNIKPLEDNYLKQIKGGISFICYNSGGVAVGVVEAPSWEQCQAECDRMVEHGSSGYCKLA